MKKVCIMLLSIAVFSLNYVTASAKEVPHSVDTNEASPLVRQQVKLLNVEIPTPFSSDTIKTEHEENGSKVVVTDKKSRQILAVYSETITKESVQKNDKYWRSHLEVSFRKSPVTILVYTDLIVSKKEGQAPQIESVPYIYQTEANIAGFKLKSLHASV